MRAARLLLWVLCALAVLPVGAAVPEEEETFLVGDFEEAVSAEIFKATASRAERVPAGAGCEGHVLRWTVDAGAPTAWISIYCVPDDLRPYRTLAMRVRADRPLEDEVAVRFREAQGTLTAYLPTVTEAWTTVELPLPRMARDGDVLGQAPYTLRFVCWESKGFTLELDDVRMIPAEGGWRFTNKELRAQGRDPAGARYRVFDAEGDRHRNEVFAVRSAYERVAVKGRKKGHCLRWTVSKTGETVWLTVLGIPQDIRAYRSLKFRARVKEKKMEDAIFLRFRSDQGAIGAGMPPLKRKWTDVEVLLPRMTQRGEFDPEGVEKLWLVCWGPNGFTLELDDMELVKGPGGWRMSEEEHLAFVFGKKRAKKVKQIDTDHFTIYTDSAAARRKFPKALEKTYAFVCEALALGEMPEKLPVYIFQNPTLYHEFCVRKGWSLEAAQRTAGHAARDYFATYYQAAETPTVTHELTHSIFHRTRGTGGGSWFQEGVAVYVEELSQKRSAARVFAPRLRSGQYMPVRKFVSSGSLIRHDDVRGGAGTSGSLYQQAGAFFDFLLRGPYGTSRPGAIEALALLDTWDPEAIAKAVEEVLGDSLEDVEKAWLAWGGDPPEPDAR